MNKTQTIVHFLSLIIPVYKQEKTILPDLKRIKKNLDTIRYDYEIIAVVDGRVDRSYQKIKKANLNKVTCFTYFKNQGKAYAIRHGIAKAKGDYIMLIDAGKEIDPNGISMLLEHMEWYGADIIVGSKRHPASRVRYTFDRKILSYGYYYLVKILFGLNITDTQAGIKIFKRRVIKKIYPKLLEKRFVGDLEMLVIAKYYGFEKIYEAPIKINYDFPHLTTAATWGQIWAILLDTLALFVRKNLKGFN
jgi:glycosyltransferase involved in cell wall biosynthesis